MTSQVPKVQKNNELPSRISGNINVEISILYHVLYYVYLIKLNYFIRVLLVIEEDAETLIASLKHEELTWPDIEMIWAKTSGYRLNHLKSTNFSPSEIHKTWPQYMQPLGYKLVSKLILIF